ncbi:iron complex outermembrane receptor protein [Epilithonimonas hungarica]|uniref:TonB-dependent receptor plug domain-containing protein n=1 Tax=Epilithonimonas hungarica TaxID=454006 RepID=UPI00278B5431|nr:TonB-dependent receptor [Epilithonimonas hungarica]MDP9957693.1 iron complex outermembrane receptor protein [Epilithonimonas hungarica]
MMKRTFAFFFIGLIGQVSAQESLIDTVFIDNQFSKVSKTAKISNLNSDKILENSTSLSDLLRFQSNIYIKENGRGATSSPGFRGTTAQQTAFVWNGININSIFLGQGDVNNMNPLSYENVGIKFGGGSVIYGSSAIGGSIHLNNILDFDKGFSGTLFSEYGSFGTSNSLAQAKFSNGNFSFNVNINHSRSENDYEVPQRKFINRNGEYQNTSFNLGLAYKINPNNEFYWQSQLYDSEQHYPVFSENQTKTKYQVQTFRSLAGWKFNSKSIKNNFKLAYLEDNFQYFGDINKTKTSGGTGKQYIIKNDFDLLVSKNSSFNLITEYQYNEAEGFGSGIKTPKRNLGSFSLLYRNSQSEKFYWELGAKQEIVEDYKSPFLFSASGKYTINNWYQTTLNISRNFRAPTFNDLYWQPGGNPDLKPETSNQVEMSHNFSYKNFKLGITPYYMHIVDEIVWNQATSTIWTPKNISKVDSYGLEANLTFDKNFERHHIFSNLSYTYSRSVDLETKKQLRYVPKQRVNFNANYEYSFIGFFVQAFYNGKTYTDNTENNFVKEYMILNLGTLAKISSKVQLGFKVNNITNQIYQTVDYYFMPQRNYAVNLKLNF